MTYRVHIKIADRGWILEKCASEIARRANNVSFGTHPDPGADIQYYINYSARSERVSPIEVGLFTHLEEEDNAARRFFAAAHGLDHAVCMSRKYADILKADAVDGVSVIAPGVDVDAFRPKVRIGVVGRTYHTGRKGEALVAQVMDTPGVEWRFTGSGWPGPSTHVPSEAMPDFYNDLDYVLVPALYEGGPMCVLEGLACGVPVISSDVGWAWEYPHIPFENGNAESLRAVLSKLVAEREGLRKSVIHRTWDAWADENLALFDRLAPKPLNGAAGAPRRAVAPVLKNGVVLATHGGETKTLGGPSVRVPRTAAELAKLGVASRPLEAAANNFPDGDVVHIFNAWPIESALALISRSKLAGKRVVFSPIYLNLTHWDTYSRKTPQIVARGAGERALTASLAALAREVEERGPMPSGEPFAGYHARLATAANAADEIICLSDYERRCLLHLGVDDANITIVRNGVDADRFARADASAFTERFGIDDYLLCVGRIEPRKNQLLLAHAAKRLGKRLVLIGHEGSPSYANLVRRAGGDNLTVIPRIDNADPALAGAFAGAAAFCLPSWAEGAPLAALEAAAAGAPLVLSDRSSEQEYFETFAHYANPADLDGLCQAIEGASAEKTDTDRANRLRERMKRDFGWGEYAANTLAVYEKLEPLPATAPADRGDAGPLYFDLTTSAHFTGNPTGIARVEDRAYRAALELRGESVVPIAWNSRSRNFLKLRQSDSLAGLDLDRLDALEASGEAQILQAGALADGGRVIVVGGAWIRNPNYVMALRNLKLEHNIGLTVLIHDLIQMKLNHLYPEGAGDEFAANARLITSIADDFLCYSDATAADLKEFLQDKRQHFKKIQRFRIGDMTDLGDVPAESEQEREIPKAFKSRTFALYVSSIDVRKNHALLVNVWRRLIEERGARAPHLVLVGRPLWRGEEIVQLIEREPGLSGRVHLLQDVDDADLDWLYEKCAFTVYPSLYEGWGLPVAESLNYGKVCICSNTSSVKEIWPQLTDRLDPYDFRAWLDRIALYLDNPNALQTKEREIRETFKEATWGSAMTEIFERAASAPSPQPALPTLPTNATVYFSTKDENGTGRGICFSGWADSDRTGRWMLGRRAVLKVSMLGRSRDVFVRLRLGALAPSNDAERPFRISVNGQRHGDTAICGTAKPFDFVAPAPAVGETYGGALRPVTIEIEALDAMTPSSAGLGDDDRELGVKLYELTIAADREGLDAAAPFSPEEPSGQSAAQKASRPAQPAAPNFAPPVLIDQSARERLAVALDRTYTPRRLPDTKPIYKILRATGLDFVFLALYNKLLSRTHDSVRRVIDVIQNPAE